MTIGRLSNVWPSDPRPNQARSSGWQGVHCRNFPTLKPTSRLCVHASLAKRSKAFVCAAAALSYERRIRRSVTRKDALCARFAVSGNELGLVSTAICGSSCIS